MRSVPCAYKCVQSWKNNLPCGAEELLAVSFSPRSRKSFKETRISDRSWRMLSFGSTGGQGPQAFIHFHAGEICFRRWPRDANNFDALSSGMCRAQVGATSWLATWPIQGIQIKTAFPCRVIVTHRFGDEHVKASRRQGDPFLGCCPAGHHRQELFDNRQRGLASQRRQGLLQCMDASQQMELQPFLIAGLYGHKRSTSNYWEVQGAHHRGRRVTHNLSAKV